MPVVEQREAVVDATRALREDATVLLEVAELLRDLRLWLSVGTQSSSGAIVAWLDHETDAPAFDYPEITGYALTHFAGSPLDGDELRWELETARKAADWLTHLIDEEQLAARAGWDSHAIYNFDLAMMANGLMEIGLTLGEDRFVEYGLSLVSLLIQQLERYGHLPSIDQVSPASQRDTWSTQGFAHLIKTAQCMLTAADLGLGFAQDAATTVVAKGLQGQQVDGRILTHRDDEVTMLHPHLYAVEGLWAYGTATGNEEMLACARRAVGWAFQQRLPSGGFPRYVVTSDGTLGPEQCDVTAQLVRAALLTGFAGDVEDVPSPVELRWRPGDAHAASCSSSHGGVTVPAAT
jgi:hypothetical protein